MDVIISGNDEVLNYIRQSNVQDKTKEGASPSIFNYCQPEKTGGTLVYNTLCNSLVRVTKAEKEKLMGRRQAGRNLREAFLQYGLWKTSGVDELKLYIRWAEKRRSLDKPYLSLNITSTLKCNAHCAYCYEKAAEKKDFSKARLAALVRFIKGRWREHDKVAVTWFGGEPLLQPEVLDYVTRELKQAKIEFSSYVITNGSLITKTMIRRKFPSWKVKDVQISLDGLKDTYERRKAYLPKKKNVFDHILDAIRLIAEAHIRMHIRLNIDRENSEEILRLVSLLEEHFGDLPEVTYYPAFLTGVGLDMSEEEKVSYIQKMFSRTKDLRKTNAPRRLYQPPKDLPCMRQDPHSLTVDVAGNVYTCEHLVGRPKEAIGTIWDFDEKKNAVRTRLRLRPECKKCVFLPKCLGGCVSNLETHDEACMIEKYMIQGYLAYMARN